MEVKMSRKDILLQARGNHADANEQHPGNRTHSSTLIHYSINPIIPYSPPSPLSSRDSTPARLTPKIPTPPAPAPARLPGY